MDSDIGEDNMSVLELALKEVANAFGMTVHLPIIPSGNGVVTVKGKFLD